MTAATEFTTAAKRVTDSRDPQAILDAVQAGLWDREIALLTRDYPYDVTYAERLLGQAVAYLITAIETWDQNVGIGCGYLVDTAVHAIILDTKAYREFCEMYHGRFLDHIPEIDRKADGSVEKTATIIEKNGFTVDWALWEHDYLKCTPCHAGDTKKCH